MSPGGPGPWLRLRRAAAGLALALLGLACLLLRGAAGAWGALRPGPGGPRRPGLRGGHKPAKAAANGGPPAMGSHMGRPEPRPAGGAGAGAALPGPSRRLCAGDHLTPPTRFARAPHRRYPIQQAQYSSLGAMPTVCLDGYQRKSLLSARNSSMVRSPVTVKIARPDSNLAHSPLLEQLVSPVTMSCSSTLDPCAKETVLNALKESRKRAVEEEEDQNFSSAQENKRRRHDSSGSGQSAFEPLIANGAPASLVPKPGTLKRALVSQCLDDCLSKRSRTSSISSMNNTYTGGIPSSIRNAIASSYSSTRGLSKLWKRSGLTTSPFSSPASSRSQTPERPSKKAREDDLHWSSTSTPVKSDKELQTEKALETPVRKKQSSLTSPALSGSSGKRKRKIQLLSSRRGDQLTLPPPPQLGYAVTAEDLDAEKKAALQWFNKVLEDKPVAAAPSTAAETRPAARPLSFTLASAEPTTVSSAPLVASTGSLLESLKKMQSCQSAVTLPASTGAATTSQLPLTVPAVSVDSSSPATTLSDSKPGLTLNLPAPVAPPSSTAQPVNTGSNLPTPASSDVGQTSTKAPSPPKPSILFGMLSTTPASQPGTAATSTTPTATPMFKPVFGTLPEGERVVHSVAGTSTAGATSAGSVPPLTASSSTTTATTFKPIFGSLASSAAPGAAASPFTFKQPSQPPSAADLTTPSSTDTTSVFASLSNAVFTTAATAASTQSAPTDTTTKPAFSFGLGVPLATSAPNSTTLTASTSTSTSQPLLFGALPNPAPSTAASFTPTAPIFQFGKPASITAPATSAPAGSTFVSAPPNAAQAAPSTTTGFNIFGGTNLTSSTPPTTCQSTPSFGSSTTAFGSSFGTSANPPPPYPGAAGQPGFATSGPDSQQPTNKPAAGPTSFSTPAFGFGASTTQSAVQPAFGTSSQPVFGGSNTQVSFGTNSTQPTFGGTTSVFSFGTATTSTTSSFGSNTQPTKSGTGSLVFGGPNPSPFTFGMSNQQNSGASAFGIGAPALSGATPTVAFNFGAGQNGSASTASPFGSSLTQTAGAPNQSTPFTFTVPGTPDSRPMFGGTATPPFGQSTPAPGAGPVGSTSLSFGTPSTPGLGFGGARPSFGPSTPAFSIGAGSKTGPRQRLQARRQHPRKK
ncbi:nuclear envelope pore membrane protein POM 121 isoform X2 [Carettochelys insculpta]|uniref:nuclear envelope pore membrane protein POM 121 isoform X2 n=1 Tax=Carettochelys insculpta TaxID=44489 RepID=UPI003EBD5D01